MAKSTNLLLSGITGRLGPFSIRQMGGKTIVCLAKNNRKRNSPPTEKQDNNMSLFRRNIIIAKALTADAVLKEEYAKTARNGQSAFNVAFSDAHCPPRVEHINTNGYKGRPGDLIEIRATDDFKVVKVKVTIHSSNGELIEEGNAALSYNGIDWMYPATAENYLYKGSKIKAIATDIPGNEGMLEVPA